MQPKSSQKRTLAPPAALLVQSTKEALWQTLRLAVLRLHRAETFLGESRRVGIHAKENLLVVERVLLLDSHALGARVARRAEHALDFGAIDEAAKVGLGHDARRKLEALLALVDGVE